MGATISEWQFRICDGSHRANVQVVAGSGVERLARLLPKRRHLRRNCHRIFSESVDGQDFGGSNILMQLDENGERGAEPPSPSTNSGGRVVRSAPCSLLPTSV